jgi:hypothetical protein
VRPSSKAEQNVRRFDRGKDNLRHAKTTISQADDARGPRGFPAFGNAVPPILSLTQAAELAGLKANTLKRKVSEGDFSDSVARRKPLRFWRDRYVKRLFTN